MSHADRAALESWVHRQDPEAFKQLVSRYAGLVYGTCLRILKNPADAEDVAQESFAALAFAPDARKVRSLGAWLHQVATNLSLRRIRSEARRAKRDIRYVNEATSPIERNHDDLLRYVDAAIAELPHHLRVPLVAHFLQDRTQLAIAEELGVSRQLVTHRIAQGLARVRKSLRRKGIPITAVALATLFTERVKAEAPVTLLTSLGKVALAGTSTTAAPHIAFTVAGMGRAGILGGLAMSKPIAVVVTVTAAISLGMVATCDRDYDPPLMSDRGIAAERVAVIADAGTVVPIPEAKPHDAVQTAYELRMAGMTEEATSLLLATIKNTPDDGRAYFELARTAMHGILPQDLGGDRKIGEKHVSDSERLAGWAIQKAIEADPENAHYHYWSGLIASYSAVARIHTMWTLPSVPGRISDALAAYETALKFDPDYHQARYELAGLYDRLPFYLGGRTNKFKKHLKELEARSPEWATRLVCDRSPAGSSAKERTADLNNDVERWEMVLREYPDSAVAHEGAARTHLSLFRAGTEGEAHAAQAESHTAAAIALDPARAHLLNGLAKALYYGGDHARAEAAARHYLDMDPVAPLAADTMRLLAKIYDEEERVDEAAQLREEANAIHPIGSIPELPPDAFFSPPE